ERTPPELLTRANELAAAFPHRESMNAVQLLHKDAAVLAAHRAMLPDGKSCRRGEYDVDLLVGIAKVNDCDTIDEAAAMLTPQETFSVLSDADALQQLMSKRGACGSPPTPISGA